eukprot:scaffold698_cov397-Pinguiococcus_pyrenoidosus.AAC.3
MQASSQASASKKAGILLGCERDCKKQRRRPREMPRGGIIKQTRLAGAGIGGFSELQDGKYNPIHHMKNDQTRMPPNILLIRVWGESPLYVRNCHLSVLQRSLKRPDMIAP